MQFDLNTIATRELPRPTAVEEAACFHCGAPCPDHRFAQAEKVFCCHGCQTVFELLSENGLGQFYALNSAAGVRMSDQPAKGMFAYLDEPAVRSQLVEFSDGQTGRVSFYLPAIHCIGCVWLLENLFRLSPGIGAARVNFPRKRVTISFDEASIPLSEVVELLASLGYPPELKLSDLEKPRTNPATRRLYLQIGLAGFSFGNTMLFSISNYLGLDSFSGPSFQRLVGWISLILAIPVVIYSAADYWRSAWLSLRQRHLTLDVPIAAGIAALFSQSVFDVVSGRGEGYFDSLCGLLFYLLCGKLFQQKTYDRLAFDRDYRSFFPLSVIRIRHQESGIGYDQDKLTSTADEETRVALSQLRVGDHVILRHGELIPADSRLVTGGAVIDYSFVTGEAIPVEKNEGDHLYAGGRQVGGAIEIEMIKPVSQSYLTSLWDQEIFQKSRENTFNTMTNRLSPRFTLVVMIIAVGAAIFWGFVDPARSLKSFTSVLIVACPCALALAAPFALGSAQRVLGRRNIFLRNPYVLESLAQVNTVVFDKTGTLTSAGSGHVSFSGTPLRVGEQRSIQSLAAQSTHPLSITLAEALQPRDRKDPNTATPPVFSFLEIPGRGLEGRVAGHEFWLGSEAWLKSRGATDIDSLSGEPVGVAGGSKVHVAIDTRYRGAFQISSTVRPETDRLLRELAGSYEVALLSGDNERERERFVALLGPKSHLHFNQSPMNKLGFVESLQQSGQTVMMVGDGLNDAGALRQSDVGVAVVEDIGAFSPASDVIMKASLVPQTAVLLGFSKSVVRVVRVSFIISTLYNVVGVAIAATGHLSPIVCAILMPLSSVSVVGFACGATNWLGRRSRLDLAKADSEGPSIIAKFGTKEGQRE